MGVPLCGGLGLYVEYAGKLKGVKTRLTGCERIGAWNRENWDE